MSTIDTLSQASPSHVQGMVGGTTAVVVGNVEVSLVSQTLDMVLSVSHVILTVGGAIMVVCALIGMLSKQIQQRRDTLNK